MLTRRLAFSCLARFYFLVFMVLLKFTDSTGSSVKWPECICYGFGFVCVCVSVSASVSVGLDADVSVGVCVCFVVDVVCATFLHCTQLHASSPPDELFECVRVYPFAVKDGIVILLAVSSLHNLHRRVSLSCQDTHTPKSVGGIGAIERRSKLSLCGCVCLCEVKTLL